MIKRGDIPTVKMTDNANVLSKEKNGGQDGNDEDQTGRVG